MEIVAAYRHTGSETLAGWSVDDGRRVHYLDVVQDGTNLEITLAPPSDFRSGPLGGRRLRNAKILFRRFVGELSIDSGKQTVSTSTSVKACKTKAVLLAVAKLDRRLSASFDGPISGRTLREVLNITSVEQARWLRDERLPSCARQRIGAKVGSFSVPVHDAKLVAMLERRPDIIAAWRDQDGGLPRDDDTMEIVVD